MSMTALPPVMAGVEDPDSNAVSEVTSRVGTYAAGLPQSTTQIVGTPPAQHSQPQPNQGNAQQSHTGQKVVKSLGTGVARALSGMAEDTAEAALLA